MTGGTSFTRSAGVWNSDRGEFINEKHARLADALYDYNHGFSLVYIPESQREAADIKPFAILHTPSNTTMAPYIIRYLTAPEMENIEEVLGWVFENDLSKGANVLQKLEARENAKKVLDMAAREDELAEMADIAMSVAKSPLHSYRLGKGKKIEG